MAGLGWSWGRIIERAGVLLLAVLSLIITWVLAVRAFEWLLAHLE